MSSTNSQINGLLTITKKDLETVTKEKVVDRLVNKLDNRCAMVYLDFY